MLHPRAGYALHFREIKSLLFQSLKHEVHGVEPHGYGREDLTLGGVREDAFLDTIFGEIGVEVDFGFVGEFEVGFDCYAWTNAMRLVWWGS
jgi:hypothetical protein